jgi:integrase
MKRGEKQGNATKKQWTKSRVPNLVKYVPTGAYFGRSKVGNRLVYQSLETFDCETAVNKLPNFMAKIAKQRAARKKNPGKILFRELYQIYREQTERDPELKPASKKARLNSLKRLESTWPKLAGRTPGSLSYDDVEAWTRQLKRNGTNYTPPGAKKAIAGNSSSSINKSVHTLQRLLDLAVRRGLAVENVARIKGLTQQETAAKGHIPSKEEFSRIAADLDRSESGKPFAFGVRFVAYTGCRINEATAVTWRDIDFEKEEVAIRGTKTQTSYRTLPMSSALRALLEKRLAQVKKVAPKEYLDLKVLGVSSLNKRLAEICKKIGIPKITNHDLRDYFITTCLEAGIPVHAVATWVGHKDGGALLLKRYAHLRDQHSIEVARKLQF